MLSAFSCMIYFCCCYFISALCNSRVIILDSNLTTERRYMHVAMFMVLLGELVKLPKRRKCRMPSMCCCVDGILPVNRSINSIAKGSHSHVHRLHVYFVSGWCCLWLLQQCVYITLSPTYYLFRLCFSRWLSDFMLFFPVHGEECMYNA